MVKVWEPQGAHRSSLSFIERHHYPLLAATFALAALVAFGPAPEGLGAPGQRVLGIFTLCSILWVTGLIPLQITSILAIVLLPLLDIMKSAEAFSLFGNTAVFFILGAFILSAALIDCGLSTRLTCLALKRFAHSPKGLRNALLFITAFASFWMSEHAVAAMCFPIVVGIVQAFRLEPLKSRFGASFFLAMAWGCIIGGIATYLGGARNPLAAGILFQQTGIEISFFRLFSASLPIVAIILALALVVLNRLFPAEELDLELARKQLAAERERIGPLSRREIYIGLIALGTIVAWVFLQRQIGLANIALIAVALLFIFRLVTWAELETNINWGIILMYGGAIALGSALHSSGASVWIVDNSIGLFDWQPWQLILLMGLVSLVLTEFISNAAVVSVMMPIGLSLAHTHGVSAETVTLAIALPSGLSFIMPMGTPATAIAYSSGYMTQKEFVKYGLLLNALSLAAFALVVFLYWPLIGLR